MDIQSELSSVFQTVFDREDLQVYDAMTANDVDGWDSVSHISLVISIEEHFKVRLTTSEVSALKNVGDMMGLIKKKLGHA